jgi:hypothetical protein
MEHRVGGPSYRWNLALQRVDSQRRSWAQHLDEPTQQATAYLRMVDQVGRERANREYPMIAAACTLFQNDQAFQTFKLSLLGNLSRVEIAVRLDVEQEVIEIAEALVFDIKDMRRTAGWMSCHVFIPEVKAGDIDLAAKMRLAYHGGPVMARALLDADENLPLDEAQQIVDQEMLLHSKLQAALEIELDANSALEYVKNFMDYDLARRKVQLEREKFQHACELAREKRAEEEVQQGDIESLDKVSSQNPADGDGNGRLAGTEPVDRTKLVA